ncbi:aminotransferase class V-fold PLP-dependent enzyme [Sorangium sp. So ce590]|uniref:aminotransferase class V-fold PLP-dependent enzyme n=1 Tax=unclassified Sorangium TaxID=2621164 RepID=UPI003F618D03
MLTAEIPTAKDGSSSALRSLPEVVGAEHRVEIPGRGLRRVVRLNAAATTPPLRATLDAVTRFLGHYGALHRGSGPLARAACEDLEAAIASIRSFLGCGPEHHLLFCDNTSGAISQLARMLALKPDDAVVISEGEHTSNNLPWRFTTRARVVDVRSFDDGSIDEQHLGEVLGDERLQIRVVAVSGASNQTGYIPDLRRLSELARSRGALLFVDAAQLAPHRPIDMVASGIDALALSAHKLYAPFGVGLLVVPKRLLDTAPLEPGGGSIDMLSDVRGDATVVWAPPTLRHQPGTWNGTGIVALGASCEALAKAGWDVVIEHERQIVERMAARLSGIEGLRLHVPAAAYGEHRIGAFPFSIAGMHHALLAAVLDHEHAIEVRAGTICNHRLVRRWFGVSDEEQQAVEARIRAGDRLASYGIVRASVGIHTTLDDVDALGAALEEILAGGPRLTYEPIQSEEAYRPAG